MDVSPSPAIYMTKTIKVIKPLWFDMCKCFIFLVRIRSKNITNILMPQLQFKQFCKMSEQ